MSRDGAGGTGAWAEASRKFHDEGVELDQSLHGGPPIPRRYVTAELPKIASRFWRLAEAAAVRGTAWRVVYTPDGETESVDVHIACARVG